MQGLNVSKANMVVYVHPCHSKNVPRAILRELSSLLFKFNDSFDGVVLAYSVNSLDKVARILPGVHPYFGVKLKAQLLLFSPKPDMQLEGKVVKVTRESIHLIILGFASAVIPDKEIRDEFRYKHKHGESRYVSRSDKHHVIKVGTVVRFIVKSLVEEIMHICGSLVPADTGSVSWLEGNGNTSTSDGSKKRSEPDGDVSAQERKSKKRKKSEDN